MKTREDNSTNYMEMPKRKGETKLHQSGAY